MEINGREIALKIRQEIIEELKVLQKKGVFPKIAVITLGPEDTWQTYVNQKLKFANELKIKTLLINLSHSEAKTLFDIVSKLDEDKNVHGIIIQRPVPENIDREKLINSISAIKDIDGFRQDSLFEVPAWLAVKKIIEQTRGELNNKKVVVIGKGETAGGPVIKGLKKIGVDPIVIDSKTENQKEKLRDADIIISAVGKTIINTKQLKRNALLIGIGVHRENGKLFGDYLENEAINGKDYTPTPGGVGPINLAFLFKNLTAAASLSVDKKAQPL